MRARWKVSLPPSWLDPETHALVSEIIGLYHAQHPDVLAVIFYGSVARHEERPLTASAPSQ